MFMKCPEVRDALRIPGEKKMWRGLAGEGGGRLIIDQEGPLRPTIERFPQEGEIPRKLSLLINCPTLEV